MTKPFSLQGLRRFRGGLACAGALLLSACAGERLVAEAWLAPVPGGSATGRAVFASRDDGLALTAHVAGLAPGVHSLGLGSPGDCDAIGAAASRELAHAETDAWGNAGFSAVLRGLTFAEIVGRPVAVHAATRVRLACGVAVRQ
jgi:hypothetical protein